jgi:hypothetical protein
MEELKTQYSELLQAYRRYHLRDDTNPEDGGIGFEEKADVARDTFRAAFANRLTRDEPFLINESDRTVLDRLLEWTRESNAPLMEGAEDSQRRYTVTNAQQCSTLLGELTSQSDTEHGSAVWPFIRKIWFVFIFTFPPIRANIQSVYLKAHILSKGLILVDLPGKQKAAAVHTCL